MYPQSVPTVILSCPFHLFPPSPLRLREELECRPPPKNQEKVQYCSCAPTRNVKALQPERETT